jgi:hypothetical protein
MVKCYWIDAEGNPSTVVTPIALWRQIFPDGVSSSDSMAEGIEDYCLNRAMDEAKEMPLLDREAALAFLQEDEG